MVWAGLAFVLFPQQTFLRRILGREGLPEALIYPVRKNYSSTSIFFIHHRVDSLSPLIIPLSLGTALLGSGRGGFSLVLVVVQ